VFGDLDESWVQYRCVTLRDELAEGLACGTIALAFAPSMPEQTSEILHRKVQLPQEATLLTTIVGRVDCELFVHPGVVLPRVVFVSRDTLEASPVVVDVLQSFMKDSCDIQAVDGALQALRDAERSGPDVAALVPSDMTPMRLPSLGVSTFFQTVTTEHRSDVLVQTRALRRAPTDKSTSQIAVSAEKTTLANIRKHLQSILNRTESPGTTSVLPDLPLEVQERLRSLKTCRYYRHDPVKVMDDVWRILGVPLDSMIKSLALWDPATGRTALCSVKGTHRLSSERVQSVLGPHWTRIAHDQLGRHGYAPGAMSPLTVPLHTISLLDTRIQREGRLFVGSGDSRVSLAIDSAELWRSGFCQAADIAEDGL
jgi:prolyl-tRNA editing enzyme YbaK/EbsC (Cys-tRNA(Pro) deacylase)